MPSTLPDHATPGDRALSFEGAFPTHALSLTPAAVAALFNLPERQVRQEAEHGILPSGGPPRWKATLVTRPDMPGGEAVFPSSRRAVRHVTGLVENGENIEAIREDYPYLFDENIHFAHVFARAYPKLGRPTSRRETSPR